MKQIDKNSLEEQIYELVGEARVPFNDGIHTEACLFDFCMGGADDDEGYLLSEKLIKLFSILLQTARKDMVTEMEKMIDTMDELIKPQNHHCDACRAIIDGWNCAVELIRDNLRLKLQSLLK